jgi:hypothetical protein
MAVSWPDAPLRFERLWLPGKNTVDKPEINRGFATPTDYRKLADAVEAFLEVTELLRVLGRPKLSGHWRTTESFRAEVDPLIRQLRAEGKAEGRQQVAEYMPATAWQEHGQTVSLYARVRRLERATKNLLKMTWDEYTRSVK